jgi:ABC-type nitrate/sulfonate/bicarbonate transport system substrate-binding protein
MRRANTIHRMGALVVGAVLCFTAAACGGGSEERDTGGESLSIDQVKMAEDNGDWMDQIVYTTADEKYWGDLGFAKPAKFAVTNDYIAGLVGGSIWMGQGESDAIWGAMAEGSVPLTFVGVHMDVENWILGAAADVDPKKLEGLKITGGEPGTRNVTTGRKALEELGVDPDKMKWVTVPGGSEARFRALVSGQVDIAVLQADLIAQLDEEGGQLIYNESKTVPQAGFVTKTETMKKNKDAVCAFIEGQVAARQWLSEGDDHMVNFDAAVEIGNKHGLKSSESDRAGWKGVWDQNLSVDTGATAESFEQWNDDMIELKVVPADFEWKKHVDMSCVWDAQKKFGLDLNPDPASME